MKNFALCAFWFPLVVFAQTDPPELTSWIINTTGLTGYNGIHADVDSVQYSDNNVYVRCSGIPAYSIGPWGANPNRPSNQNYLFRIPRRPAGRKHGRENQCAAGAYRRLEKRRGDLQSAGCDFT